VEDINTSRDDFFSKIEHGYDRICAWEYEGKKSVYHVFWTPSAFRAANPNCVRCIADNNELCRFSIHGELNWIGIKWLTGQKITE
jgi:hypothetical protein